MKKKKNPQEDLGPQKIDFRFDSERMIFEVGDKEFYLSRDKANFLFKRNVELEFEKVNNQDEDFSAFETLEALSLFSFHSRRRMPIREIAEELNFPVHKYVRWLNKGGKWITGLLEAYKVEINKRVAELEKENPLSEEPKKEKEFWPNPLSSTGTKVAISLLDGLITLRQIAEKLKVPYDKFYKWYTDKEVQRCLMKVRNQEAEKRRRNAEKDVAQNE